MDKATAYDAIQTEGIPLLQDYRQEVRAAAKYSMALSAALNFTTGAFMLSFYAFLTITTTPFLLFCLFCMAVIGILLIYGRVLRKMGRETDARYAEHFKKLSEKIGFNIHNLV